MKKLFFLVLLVLSCAVVSAQIPASSDSPVGKDKKVHMTVAFNSNIPSAPYGGALFVHLPAISFYMDCRFGGYGTRTSNTGPYDVVTSDVSWFNSYPIYPNSGFYAIGEGGNVEIEKGSYTVKTHTERIDSSMKRGLIDIGLAKNIIKRERYSLKAFAGAGIYLEKKTKYHEANISVIKHDISLVEDMWAVLNPPSYHFIANTYDTPSDESFILNSEEKKMKINVNFGLLFTIKYFSLGVGMDTYPLGGNAMVGVTF